MLQNMRKQFAGLATATAVALLTGCSDEPTGPGSDELSQSEAAGISAYVVGATFSGWDFADIGGGQANLRQGGEPITIDYSVDVTAPCPEGGTLAVGGSIAGTIDDETSSGDLTLDFTTSATDCGIVADGMGFTIDTNPDLRLAGDFSFADGAPVGVSTFTYSGAVLWEAEDGRSGSCSYDVVVTVSPDGSTAESGTVCGTSV